MPTEQLITNNLIIVRLICKEKKAYVSNLTICDITENKTFWRKVMPFFSEKINLRIKMTQWEKGKL